MYISPQKQKRPNYIKPYRLVSLAFHRTYHWIRTKRIKHTSLLFLCCDNQVATRTPF